jgi:hypothetical protein
MNQETRSAHATQLPGRTSRSDEDLLKRAYWLVSTLRSELNWRRPPWARRFLKPTRAWMDAYEQTRDLGLRHVETQNQTRGVESSDEPRGL